jgi:hypothetical protein
MANHSSNNEVGSEHAHDLLPSKGWDLRSVWQIHRANFWSYVKAR